MVDWSSSSASLGNRNRIFPKTNSWGVGAVLPPLELGAPGERFCRRWPVAVSLWPGSVPGHLLDSDPCEEVLQQGRAVGWHLNVHPPSRGAFLGRGRGRCTLLPTPRVTGRMQGFPPPGAAPGGRREPGAFGASVGRPRAGGWRRGVRFCHESRRGTLIWHASREFAPRCEPHPARAKWGPMIRMGSGSSLAFQRLSRDTLKFILGVKVGGNAFSGRTLRLRTPVWNWGVHSVNSGAPGGTFCAMTIPLTGDSSSLPHPYPSVLYGTAPQRTTYVEVPKIGPEIGSLTEMGNQKIPAA
eukprot:gene22192-biopygen2713